MTMTNSLKAPYISAKHGIMGLARSIAKEGGKHGIRANVLCPGFVLTPLVQNQIPQQAKTLGISEEEVIRNIMLPGTVDGEVKWGIQGLTVSSACFFLCSCANDECRVVPTFSLPLLHAPTQLPTRPQFSTVEDMGQLAVFLTAFPTNVLTGQSIIASHGWVME